MISPKPGFVLRMQYYQLVHACAQHELACYREGGRDFVDLNELSSRRSLALLLLLGLYWSPDLVLQSQDRGRRLQHSQGGELTAKLASGSHLDCLLGNLGN